MYNISTRSQGGTSMKNIIYGIVGVLAVLLVTNLIITIAQGNEFKKDIFGHDDVEYITYFYKDNCSYCEAIDGDVENFIENGTIPMYKYKVTDYSDKDRKELDITGTPTMFHIKNGKLVKKYVGADECVELMKNFR